MNNLREFYEKSSKSSTKKLNKLSTQAYEIH